MATFIDNPVIASLGVHLGMGDMFDDMRSASPSDAPAAPTSPVDPQQVEKPARSAPNVPEYKNRPYIPRQETPATRGVSPGGNNPIPPGSMDPATLQSPQVKALLGQYGVTPPTTAPDPNLFIHNPQAFENHPIISGLVERGLEGLAYAHPGQNFFQSLIGGVKGMQEANAARGEQYNAQTMAPIQQASAIQQLQQKYDAHTTSMDNIAYHQGMLKHYNQMDNDKETKALNVPPRMNNETGEMMTLQSDEKSPTGYSWKVAPELGRDEVKYQKSQIVKQGMQAVADKKYNGDITQLTPQDSLGVVTGLESADSMAKGASAQAVGAAHDASAEKRARIRVSIAGGRGAVKMTPGDAKQYTDIDEQDKAIGNRLKQVTTVSVPYTDDNGKIITPGSTAHKAYISQLQSQQNQVRSQKGALEKKYGATDLNNSPSAAPKYSSGNPFAK